MKLYHGSYIEITIIDLKKSKPYKDFGKAFYLTKYYEQAKIWANRLGREYKKEGVVTEFEFDEYAYEDESLKVLRFDKYDEQWLDFIVFNRSKRNPTHEYDIVEGPIADAITQSLVTDFDITEQQAIDVYFQSKTYEKLIDESTRFHEKPWPEIYEMLKSELKI